MSGKELERVWHSRMIEAKLRYDSACARVKVAAQDSSPDHSAAIRAERVATADYLRMLRMYTEFVLHGTIPDEGGWQRRKAAGA